MKFQNSFLVFPQDVNNVNTLFGGRLLSAMDESSAILASKVIYGTGCSGAVTKKVSEIIFHTPSYVGDLININCEVKKFGKSSMDIFVFCEREDLKKNGEKELICSAMFTFVAIKKVDGKNIPHPHNLSFKI
jgi:acyl-CoA hydrolase